MRSQASTTLDHHRVWREGLVLYCVFSHFLPIYRIRFNKMRFVVLFLSYIFTVLENISSSIFALVAKKSAHHADESQGSYERRPRVAERAEEARGGHYRKVDQLIPPKTRCDCLGSSHSSSLRRKPTGLLVADLHTWKLTPRETIVTKVSASEGVQNQIVQDFEEISSVADFCGRYVLLLWMPKRDFSNVYNYLVKYGFITLFILYNFGFESTFQKFPPLSTSSSPKNRSTTVPKTLKFGVKVPPSSTPAKENQLGDSASLQAQLDAKATTEKTVPENGSTQQTDSTPNSIPLTVEESPLLQKSKTIDPQLFSSINTNKASTPTSNHKPALNPPVLNQNTPVLPTPTNHLPEKTLVERLRISEDKTLKRLAPVTISETGRPRVLIPDSVFEKGAEIHKDFIVCYFNGKPPPFHQIQSVLAHMWGKEKPLEIHNNPRNRSALVRIRSEYLRLKILDKCIWYVGDSVFHTALWTSEHSMLTPPLKAIKIWAHLTGVPLDLRHQQGMSMVAGLVGEPKETDEFTRNLVSLTVSHVKVEVDLTVPLPSIVEFQRQSGEVVEVLVHYPWTPPTCSHCHELGHIVRNCLLYVPPPADPPPPKTSFSAAKLVSKKPNHTTSSKKPSTKSASSSKTSIFPTLAQTYVKKSVDQSLNPPATLNISTDPHSTSLPPTPNHSVTNTLLSSSVHQMEVDLPPTSSKDHSSPDPPLDPL
ncbi:hypothetical protein IGI04_006694 [Brassica rapa subsp. trilocularis]|uniref:DUF4283 domain-containing protein n=1 Tax=Brassica rapa subsp. trilocularis TaxID=1813537 RepID=A0ABQ7NHL2_BRACM|nr:hypothetical protein IGI04_006694 [Brassica rapa subsp. trilocularis]